LQTWYSSSSEEKGTVSKGEVQNIDLVTKIDKQVESFIIEEIKKDFPDHKILAEESWNNESTNESYYDFGDSPTWIIDPIDGTTNFVHKYPMVCISIGFAINRRVVVGIVYNPILNELFTAIQGKGAYLNLSTKLAVSQVKHLSEALIATNVGYDRTEEGANFMTGMLKGLLLNNVRSIRSEGTAAMDLCGVACGRLDAFYEFGVHPWDLAAGLLIVHEAGGVLIDPLSLDGKLVDIETRRLIAGNKDITKVIANILSKTPVPQKWTKYVWRRSNV